MSGRKVELAEVIVPSLNLESRSSEKYVPVMTTPTGEEANDKDHETSDQVTTEPRRSIIRRFASCFPTVIYDVFIHNNAFWSNSNAFSLIICKVHTKRENSGSWKSGPEKATSGYLFCTTPNKLKLHGDFLWNI